MIPETARSLHRIGAHQSAEPREQAHRNRHLVQNRFDNKRIQTKTDLSAAPHSTD